MSQLFELQPENLNGHGIQRPRPHKSPDKTIIISKEGEKEREGWSSVAETGTIFPGNSCQVRKLGYKLHNEPTPNRLLFRGDQSENSEACRDNISLITVEERLLFGNSTMRTFKFVNGQLHALVMIVAWCTVKRERYVSKMISSIVESGFGFFFLNQFPLQCSVYLDNLCDIF